nr:multicopper oxidase domain-containing protein [Brachybacterium timonense]
MLALIALVLTHPFVPQSRWLLVHMVTLGLVTTSIMIWGQHFAEALLKTRLGPETRPMQVRRIWLLTVGVVVASAGIVGAWPVVVLLGALTISAAMLWYAWALAAQIRASIAPRYGATVRAYVMAACLLPVGAVLGTLLAFSPGEPWQGRLLLAHQIVNVLGFVGLTVAGTLLTLWPTVLRTALPAVVVRRSGYGLPVMVLGVLGAGVSATLGIAVAGALFIAVYLGGLLWLCLGLMLAAQLSASRPHRIELPWFPILSIGAGVTWFVLSVAGLLVLWLTVRTEPMGTSLLAQDVQALTVPFVVGFALQVLLGAMSYLMPTVMGGGPRAVRASLAVMSRAAAFRVAVVNLALVLFVAAQLPAVGGEVIFAGATFGTGSLDAFGSWSRVLVSAGAFLGLAWFVVLLVQMVMVSLRERQAAQLDRDVPPPAAAPDTVRTQPSASQSAHSARATSRQGGPPTVPSPADSTSPVQRRHLTGVLLGTGGVLGLNAMGGALDRLAAGGAAGAPSGSSAGGGAGRKESASAVSPTGRTTTITVSMNAMRFTPDVLTVPAGDRLVIELRNDDAAEVHDLVLDSGVTSGRLSPGESATVDAGVIGQDVAGWCSIVGHRAMGMTLAVVAQGASTQTPGGGGGSDGSGTTVDALTPVVADLQAAPSADHARRDPVLPPDPGPDQRLTLEITEHDLEIAPGVTMAAMTFGGGVVGPVIRSQLGGRLTVDLVNNGSMGHSLDLHAGRVSPDAVMRTIPPGQSLEYTITTDYAGVWLYHCSTMPMTVHLAAGMLGALIVPPEGLAAADREYVLVQSDHYLVPEGAEGWATPSVQNPADDGACPLCEPDDPVAAHPVSPEKIAAERPDVTVFNGHANQYVHEPLTAKVGERVRIWVLAAGPSRGISFHVVGGVFDTVFAEGEYLLRPDTPTGGGAQALHLGAAQGGFVELVFDEPGTYTAVNHVFADMERGARALIEVTA